MQYAALTLQCTFQVRPSQQRTSMVGGVEVAPRYVNVRSVGERVGGLSVDVVCNMPALTLECTRACVHRAEMRCVDGAYGGVQHASNRAWFAPVNGDMNVR